MANPPNIAAVLIGRNEGPRLVRALAAVRAANVPIVYVDSGSTDDSIPAARAAGADVVELPTDRPFTAGRARNAGFARLRSTHPDIPLVQFLDGDCELCPDWLSTAAAFLDSRPDVAIVAGRLLERDREASVYNRLCALEWEKPTGPIKATGGIFLVRAAAFAAVNGFDESVPAAEDDEFCLRVRQASGQLVWSLPDDMALHDAAMTRFSQWWRRATRAGYAYAQGAAMHGQGPERHFVRDVRRIWLWAVLIPLLALAPAYFTSGWSLLLLGLFPLLALKVYRYGRRRGWSGRDARAYACFNLIQKWPMLLGLLRFHRHRRTGAAHQIIEYKMAP